MGVARSTIYDELPAATDDVAIVETMSRVCEEFERYGWRPCASKVWWSTTRRSVA